MASMGVMGAKAQVEIQEAQSSILSESSLSLAVQSRWVRGDTSSPRFATPGAPPPDLVLFDTVGIWLRAHVQSSNGLSAWLGKPIDTVLKEGLVLLGERRSVQPSSGVIVREWTRLASLVRHQAQQLTPDSISPDCQFEGNVRWWGADDWPPCVAVQVNDGDFSLETFRMGQDEVLKGTHSIRAQGQLILSGVLRFDTLRVMAHGNVKISGSVQVEWLELHTQGHLELADQVQIKGWVVADSSVVLSESAQMQAGAFVLAGTELLLQDQSVLWGYGVANAITLHPRARSYGALVTTGVLNNQGFVGGSAFAGTSTHSGRFEPDSVPSFLFQSPFLDFGYPKRYVVWK